MLNKSVMATGLAAALACAGCANSGLKSLDYNPTRVQPGLKYSAPTPVNSVAQPKWFDHILIIVLENGNKKTAEENLLLKELKGWAESGTKPADLPPDVNATYFSNFHGLFHPSYSNYLAMVSGKEVETHADQQRDLDQDQGFTSIATRFKETGKGWRNYAEGYPDTVDQCFKKSDFDQTHYQRKHVPFLSFTDIQGDNCTKHIIPINTDERKDIVDSAKRYEVEGQDSAGKFWLDWNKDKPAYSFYSPNMIHDGHDSSMEVASNWLRGFIGKLPNDFWNDTLVIVTFDESDYKNDKENTNDIYTVFLGKVVVSKVATEQYNHFNALRTIEENFGLATIGDQDTVFKPITGIWQRELSAKSEHQ